MEQRPSWETDSRSAGNKILAFYGTRRFITSFIRAGTYTESDEFSPNLPPTVL